MLVKKAIDPMLVRIAQALAIKIPAVRGEISAAGRMAGGPPLIPPVPSGGNFNSLSSFAQAANTPEFMAQQNARRSAIRNSAIAKMDSIGFTAHKAIRKPRPSHQQQSELAPTPQTKAVPKTPIQPEVTKEPQQPKPEEQSDFSTPKTVNENKPSMLSKYGPSVAAGGVGAAAGYYAGSKTKKEEKKDTKEAHIGTAFTDGFFQYCLNKDLDSEKVAAMVKAGASYKGLIGQELSDLLSRVETLED